MEKNQEEKQNRVVDIVHLIDAFMNDPDISEYEKKNATVIIAGLSIYLSCPNETDFDKMVTIIKNEYLRIKDEDLRRRN